MHLRFLRQITTIIDEQKAPDNYINPKNLSYLDTAMLKEIFKKIEKLQQKLKVEFTGTA
jgi:CBS domain-containing protein